MRKYLKKLLGVLKPRRNNSVNVVFPYTEHGQWMFDDASTGLEREAFVSGADTALDFLADIAGFNPAHATRENPACLRFCTTKFPGYTDTLRLMESGPTGSTYFWVTGHDMVWLCPALFLYYTQAPEVLYVGLTKPSLTSSPS